MSAGQHICRFPKLFLLSRCELCSLSGEQLRKDEELRKELSHQEDMFFYYLGCGRAAHALEIFAEEVLEVMEENRDKFSNQVHVRLHQENNQSLRCLLSRCLTPMASVRLLLLRWEQRK